MDTTDKVFVILIVFILTMGSGVITYMYAARFTCEQLNKDYYNGKCVVFPEE